MDNEISTISGSAATVGAAILAGATLGQVQTLNDAVVASANYTAERAKNTVVRHVGETVVMATATVGASVASAVTLGQVQTFNDAVVNCASYTAQAGGRTGTELATVADGVTDSIPVVGHVKSGICYAVGANERGARAMKGATRSIGVISGGIGGAVVGGPAGAIAGGIAGGAAMDGVITGANSAYRQEYRPHGQVAKWGQVLTATTSAERIDGIVGGIATTFVDGLTGFGAGTTSDGLQSDAPASDTNVDAGDLEPSKGTPADTGASVSPFLGGLNLVTLAHAKFDILVNTYYGGDVKKAVLDALKCVFAVYQLVMGLSKEKPTCQTCSNDHSDKKHDPKAKMAPSINTKTKKKTKLSIHEMKQKQKAKRELHETWTQVVKEFKDELTAKHFSSKTLLESPDIAKLTVEGAEQRLLDTLTVVVNKRVQNGDSSDRVILHALDALEKFVGRKTAEALRDAVTGDTTKQTLQRLWDQISSHKPEKITLNVKNREPKFDCASTSVAGITIIRPSDDLGSNGSELFFVLIAIYAALPALTMASRK